MPLYDYKCPEGHVREVRHGMSETPVVRCTQDTIPENNSFGIPCMKRMERVITGGSFILKGSGFYYTDSGPGRHHQAANAAENADIPKGI